MSRNAIVIPAQAGMTWWAKKRVGACVRLNEDTGVFETPGVWKRRLVHHAVLRELAFRCGLGTLDVRNPDGVTQDSESGELE